MIETKLKIYRVMHELTQEQLAKAVGVTRQTIISIEKGKYEPSLTLAFKLARYFQVSIEEIFDYIDSED